MTESAPQAVALRCRNGDSPSMGIPKGLATAASGANTPGS